MKGMVAVVALVVLAGVAVGQERIAPEKAQKFARLFVQTAAKVDALPLKVEPDADRPFGLKKDDVGALAIPDKALTAVALREAGQAVVPVGHLWVRNLTVIVKDQPVPNDQLGLVKITVNDQDHTLPLFLLGVRKQADGSLQMVVYAKDKQPLLSVPLRKIESKQELPIELEGKGEDGRGVLTLNILGQYQAQLAMAKQEQ